VVLTELCTFGVVAGVVSNIQRFRYIFPNGTVLMLGRSKDVVRVPGKPTVFGHNLWLYRVSYVQPHTSTFGPPLESCFACSSLYLFLLLFLSHSFNSPLVAVA
jgi:hypothetical protein